MLPLYIYPRYSVYCKATTAADTRFLFFLLLLVSFWLIQIESLFFSNCNLRKFLGSVRLCSAVHKQATSQEISLSFILISFFFSLTICVALQQWLGSLSVERIIHPYLLLYFGFFSVTVAQNRTEQNRAKHNRTTAVLSTKLESVNAACSRQNLTCRFHFFTVSAQHRDKFRYY